MWKDSPLTYTLCLQLILPLLPSPGKECHEEQVLFVCLYFAIKLKIGKLLCLFYFLKNFFFFFNKTDVSQQFFPVG